MCRQRNANRPAVELVARRPSRPQTVSSPTGRATRQWSAAGAKHATGATGATISELELHVSKLASPLLGAGFAGSRLRRASARSVGLNAAS